MAEGSIDRRILRTRKTLHDALLSLIQKKNYEAITVDEICETANVSRSTFYDHYTSKDDLKRSGLEHLRHQLLECQRGPSARQDDGRNLRFSLTMFEHAREHKHHYKALVGTRGGAIALSTIRETLGDSVRRELTAANYKGEVPLEFVVEYLVGAYMSVLTWWLDRDAKLSPAQMDAMFQDLAAAGIEQLSRHK